MDIPIQGMAMSGQVRSQMFMKVLAGVWVAI